MSDADPQQSEQRDYRDTVFLPKTDFPMKAGLPQKEPGILARWQDENLYEKLRDTRRGAEKFILHDGPPYANGDMHIGHALNRILKDMVVRTQGMMGKDAPFVPGWDCHGLPIEWKVEEQYRKKKRDKDDVPRAEFRAECRDYAAKWVDVQKGQLERLGLMADFAHPYLTMQFESEATIVAELMKFVEAGNLYRGAKPVMWSPVEKTALAEAEVEYEDITSTQIDVAFEIVESPIEELVGAHAVIWTTTPWTIPVNQAFAYGPEVEYELVGFGVGSTGWGPQTKPSDFPGINQLMVERFLIAKPLVHEFAKRMSATLTERLKEFGANTITLVPHAEATIKGSNLAGTKVHTRCTSWAASTKRSAPCCPAISSPPIAAPASSTWRPIMARTISTCARRSASNPSSRSWTMGAIATTGRGWARAIWMRTARSAAARSSIRISTRRTGRSVRTFVTRARC